MSRFLPLSVLAAALLASCASPARKPQLAEAAPPPAAQAVDEAAADREAPVLARPPSSTLPPSIQGGTAPAEASGGAAPPLAAKTVAVAPAVASQDQQDIDRVSKALNRIKTMKAEFTQIDANGLEQGRFYLDRPGRLRFEYDSGNLLVIADGNNVVVYDAKVTNPYRAKIDETPLRLLLKADVDLRTDANITTVRREDGVLMVSAEQNEGYGQGSITFFFSEPTLDLMRWIVTDPVGNQTTVTFRNVRMGEEFDQALFKPPRESIFGND